MRERATWSIVVGVGLAVLWAAVADCAIPPIQGVTVTKEYEDLNGGSLCPGDVVRFTVTVVNEGGPITNMSITDTVDRNCYESFVIDTTNPDSPFALGGTDISTQPVPGVTNGFAKVTGISMPRLAQTRLIYDATVWTNTTLGTNCCTRAMVQFGLEFTFSEVVCTEIDCLPPNSPDLDGVKTASVTDHTATFTITIINAGDGPDSDVSLVDSIDADAVDFNFISTTHGTEQYSPPPAGAYSNGQLTVSGFGLAPAEEATIVFSVDAAVTCGSSIQLCNQGEIDSDGIRGLGQGPRLTDANPNNMVPEQPTCVDISNSAFPEVDVTKEVELVSGTLWEPGERVRYTLAVDNPSTCLATDEVMDDVPADLIFDLASVTVTGSSTFTNSSQGLGFGANGTGLVAITDLEVEPETSASITWEATIADGTGGVSICNTADFRLLPFGLLQPSNEVCFDVEEIPQCPVPPEPITGVLSHKGPQSADLTIQWDEEANSSLGYKVYRVETREEIPDANATANPPSLQEVCSTAAQTDTSCVETGGVTPPPDLGFYQVVGICGDGSEGPN